MENRVTLVIDGGAGVIAIAVPPVAVLVIRELAEGGEILQPPRVGVPGALQQEIGELQMEGGESYLVVLLGGVLEGLLHQLQSAGAIALEAIDDVPAATMAAA